MSEIILFDRSSSDDSEDEAGEDLRPAKPVRVAAANSSTAGAAVGDNTTTIATGSDASTTKRSSSSWAAPKVLCLGKVLLDIKQKGLYSEHKEKLTALGEFII